MAEKKPHRFARALRRAVLLVPTLAALALAAGSGWLLLTEAVWKRSCYARRQARVALIDLGAAISRQMGLISAWRAT